MQMILSIDMGKNKSVACDYNPQDGTADLTTVPSTPEKFKDFLRRRTDRLLVIEIGPQAGWVADLCQELDMQLKIVNTTGEEWKWNRVKNKSDREDALKLAKMQAMHLHHYVHVPDLKVRQTRGLIHYRDRLVGHVTASKNRIHALLLVRGMNWPVGKKGWSKAAVQTLEEMALPIGQCTLENLWLGHLDLELQHLKHTQQLLAELEKKLDTMAEENPRVRRLTSVPGVGKRTAELVIAMLDDSSRFTNVRQVGSYTGLTPRRLQSGTMDRQRGISRQGSRLLRKMLVQASWIGLRYNPWMRDVFERLSGLDKQRRKKAIIAVARKLFVRLWAMDRDGTEWNGPPALLDRRLEKLAEAELAP